MHVWTKVDSSVSASLRAEHLIRLVWLEETIIDTYFDSDTVQKPVVEVLRGGPRIKIPESGSIVIARITKVNPRLASASLLCINTQPLSDSFTGIIR